MAAKKRPRDYTTLDREYLTQRSVQKLGDGFGPAGPLVFLAIILEAGKATGTAPGEVEMRFGSLADLAFVDVGIAGQVVTAAVEVGLLDNLDTDGERFTARLTKWELWESKDRTAAERSAAYRERKEQEPGA